MCNTATFSQERTVPPPRDPGTATALRDRACDEFYRLTSLPRPTGRWVYHEAIPVGVGMSSSTADIVATLRALGDLHGVELGTESIQHILRRLERSDPVFLDQHCVYLSRAQEILEQFAVPLRYYVFYSHAADCTRTADFSEEYLLEEYAAAADDYARSFELLHAGLSAGDAAQVAAQSTVSARLAQRYLPNRLVQSLLAVHEAVGAHGVVRAHTGSLAGLLFTAKPDERVSARVHDVFTDLGETGKESWAGLG